MDVPHIDPSEELSIHRVKTLSKLTADQMDTLPIGVIRTDREGVIREYNLAESAISGLRPADVVGKNFFTEVAPCTNVQSFAGRFRAGVEAGSLYETFPYDFEFEPASSRVMITLYHSGSDEDAWIFVRLVS